MLPPFLARATVCSDKYIVSYVRKSCSQKNRKERTQITAWAQCPDIPSHSFWGCETAGRHSASSARRAGSWNRRSWCRPPNSSLTCSTVSTSGYSRRRLIVWRVDKDEWFIHGPPCIKCYLVIRFKLILASERMLCLSFAIPENTVSIRMGNDSIPHRLVPAPFRPRLYRTGGRWLFGFQGSAIQIAAKIHDPTKSEKYFYKVANTHTGRITAYKLR